MLGLEKLLELRDPFSFWAQNTPGLREGVRFMAIFGCLQAARPSVVARSDWKEAMRLYTAANRRRELELWIVLAECTVLRARSSYARTRWDIDRSRAVQLCSDVEHKGQVLLAQLDAWRQEHDRLAGLQPLTGDPHHDGRRQSFNVFGHVDEQWEFAHLPIANDTEAVNLMLYNIARTHVLDILAGLPHSTMPDGEWYLPPTQDNQRAAASGPYTSQGRLAALETCRLVHYYLGGNAYLTPSTTVTVHWAIGLAWKKLRWADSVESTLR